MFVLSSANMSSWSAVAESLQGLDLTGLRKVGEENHEPPFSAAVAAPDSVCDRGAATRGPAAVNKLWKPPPFCCSLLGTTGKNPDSFCG